MAAAVFEMAIQVIPRKCSIGLWSLPIIRTKIASWLQSQSSVLSSASIVKSILVFKSCNNMDAKYDASIDASMDLLISRILLQQTLTYTSNSVVHFLSDT